MDAQSMEVLTLTLALRMKSNITCKRNEINVALGGCAPHRSGGPELRPPKLRNETICGPHLLYRQL